MSSIDSTINSVLSKIRIELALVEREKIVKSVVDKIVRRVYLETRSPLSGSRICSPARPFCPPAKKPKFGISKKVEPSDYGELLLPD